MALLSHLVSAWPSFLTWFLDGLPLILTRFLYIIPVSRGFCMAFLSHMVSLWFYFSHLVSGWQFSFTRFLDVLPFSPGLRLVFMCHLIFESGEGQCSVVISDNARGIPELAGSIG